MPVRVVFCGNPAFALSTLNALIGSPHEVAAVVCSPDKPRGRGRKVQPLPVKERALEAGIPLFQPVSLKDAAFLEEMQKIAPDCLVVVAFRILPRELFAMPRLGSFNVHPSLLPRGRGPAPIRWTLIRGEQETGVTIIHLTEKIDGGDILLQNRVPVEPGEDYGALHNRLSGVGSSMLLQVLDAFQQGNPPPPIAQDESLVTKAPKLTANDFVLDWTLPADDILNRIRAFSPEPGAMTFCNGMRFKILSAIVSNSDERLTAGQLWHEDGRTLRVGTGTGTICLNIVQPEGKKPMAAADFLRGRPKLPIRLGE